MERSGAPASAEREPAHALWALVAAAIGLLPFAALRALGAIVGWLAGSVLRIRRAHVEHAMRRAGIAMPEREAAAMYRHLGASLLELLWLSARRDARASQHAHWSEASRAKLEACVARGRGVVLAASHSGNWELSAAAIAEEHALTAITKRMHDTGIDAFMREARASRRIDALTPEAVLASARRVLSRGGLVGMMIDQVPARRRHAIAVDFLGARAMVDRAPALLAARARAPFVVVAAKRNARFIHGSRGMHEMHVLAVFEPPARSVPRDAARVRLWVDDTTREATRALDAFVRAHPTQWLWMHRRWAMPLP